MSAGAGHPSEAALDDIAELLGHELRTLVEAAEAVLAELEAIDELRGGGPAFEQQMRLARDARRSAMQTRGKAADLAARAADVCERSQRLAETSAARVEARRRRIH